MLGRSRSGEEGSPGSSHRPLAVASGRHRAVYEQKTPVLPLRPQKFASAAAGVRSNTFIVTPLLARIGHSAASSRPFELAEAGAGSAGTAVAPLPAGPRQEDRPWICSPIPG